jgi:hypothetical protein
VLPNKTKTEEHVEEKDPAYALKLDPGEISSVCKICGNSAVQNLPEL